MKFKANNITDLIKTFETVDKKLEKQSKEIKITVLGGASVLLLGMRDRTTVDIDVASTDDADAFQKICSEIGITVDIITMASTVDLVHCKTINVFRGAKLIVDSVTPKDLLKLKLERFYKQDPEDIYAIIHHEKILFDDFQNITREMIPDFIGNPLQLKTSAQVVVEQLWPDKKLIF